MLEKVLTILGSTKFLVFGSAGSLDKNICNNKVVVPTYAYRDEGTSYHYAPAKDYIKIKNSTAMLKFSKLWFALCRLLSVHSGESKRSPLTKK